MSRTIQLTHPRHNQKIRCRPHLERLESRRLFAVSAGTELGNSAAGLSMSSTASANATDLSGPLGVVATAPADGAALTNSPTDLLIRFNQPFDPFSTGQDIALEQVGSDGAAIPVDSSLYSEQSPLDATDTLDVTLNQPLAVGEYRIVLLGSSTLATASAGQPLANAGQDQTIADFTIKTPGARLTDATVLPAPGASPVLIASSLDFQNSLAEVRLYQFTLPATQALWQVGAEVSAQRLGSPLRTTLALLDGQGHAIATADFGRADAPNDPFLFAGLAPGTYYLGVSGAGDLPCTTGGYDPVAGTAGTLPGSTPGGRFELRVAARAARPTTLQSVHLDQADPQSAIPTGITLGFSGPLNVDTLNPAPFRSVEVVDASGKVWPVSPVSYHESRAQLALIFNQPLPAGQYSVIVPAAGGVKDLAGQGIVGIGEPAGGLGTFRVTAANPPADPHDLGPIFLSNPSNSRETATIPPRSRVTYRFVAPIDGLYKLDSEYDGGALAIEQVGAGGNTWIPSGSPGTNQSKTVNLTAGVYQLVFSNPGSAPTGLTWGLTLSNKQRESLVVNGVGQGQALPIMLIASSIGSSPAASPAPTPATQTPVSVSPSSPGSGAGGLGLGPAPATFFLAATPAPAHSGLSEPAAVGAGSPSGSGPGSGSGSSGLVLTLGGSLVGSPSVQGEHLSAVGPGTQPGTVALASNSPGLLQGITYGRTLATNRVSAWDEGEAEGPAPGAIAARAAMPENGAMAAPDTTNRADLGADDKALALMDWIGQVSPAVIEMVSLPFRDTAVVEAAQTSTPSAERVALVTDETPEGTAEAVDRADLAAPLGFVALAVGAMKLRRPFHRLFRRKGAAAVERSTVFRAGPRGPHARF